MLVFDFNIIKELTNKARNEEVKAVNIFLGGLHDRNVEKILKLEGRCFSTI